jgi:hypothetical protein
VVQGQTCKQSSCSSLVVALCVCLSASFAVHCIGPSPDISLDPAVWALPRRLLGAIQKEVAELTSQQDGVIRRYVIEQLMRRIMEYDAEFRREEATSGVGSIAKH